VPSRTIDRWHEPPAEAQAYEERMLSGLFELRDPRVRIIYVSSLPIAPAIIDYYLSLLPRRRRRHARRRLSLIALGDASPRPLAQKLLERPDVLERMRREVPEGALAQLVTYNTAHAERDLALALDIPIYGADPRYAGLGTKSGGRELFAGAGIPHPLGVERIASRDDATRAIADLRATEPRLKQLVIKLEDGVSGEGNAIIDLRNLPAPGAPAESARIARRLEALVPVHGGVTPDAFLAKLEARGGVIEERVTGLEVRSPSVQFHVTPAGTVELLSTHDQILAGPSAQTYTGCRFPADRAYATTIAELAARVADRLAATGVIGRFAIDFVVVRDDGDRWSPYAVELNLRLGGTTHPYETLAQLVGGRYDASSATYITDSDEPRYYIATDCFENRRLRALSPRRILALIESGRLGFDRKLRTGTVFHMLSALDPLGRIGVTVIAASAEQAAARFQQVQEILLAEAAAPERRRPWQSLAAGATLPL
jgi:hypothetical protein